MTTKSAERVKHTPGPWHVSKDSLDYGCERFRIYDRRHSLTAIGFTLDSSPISEANARLIAAAPELLEALKSMLDTHAERTSEETPASRKARAAIAKATKETT